MERETKIGLASFVLGVGLEVSGLTLPFVGYFLMFLGVMLFLHAVWGTRFGKVQTENSLAPNWSIRQLFFHIEPGVLDDDKADRAIEVGNQIRDKAALGQLKIWGRPLPDEGSIENLFRESHVSLEPIDENYWRKANFSYRFFTEHQQHVQHTYPDHGSRLPALADLQVNKAEALKLWGQENESHSSLWFSFFVPIALLSAVAVATAYPLWGPMLPRPTDPAYGMLAIQEFKIDKLGDDIGIRMMLKNTSIDRPMEILPQWASVQINNTLYPATTIDSAPVLPPQHVSQQRLPQFPISELKMSGEERLTINFRIKYGFAGSAIENVLCEIDHCTFSFTPPNLIGSPRCRAEVCK